MEKKWKEVNITAIISLFLILMTIPVVLTYNMQGEVINNPPNKPSRPVGPTSGEIGIYYYYTSRATDPDGDKLHYLFDWGDGSSCGTILFESGENCTLWHCWNDYGVYEIRVMAIDEYCACSEWSDPLSVAMPKANQLNMCSMLENLNKWFISMVGRELF